jgi:hypothetical protein
VRNFDWTDDKTMAAAGVQTSPRSFKFHRLLAAQLLATDPSHPETDRAVAEADQSIAILAPLPDDLDLPGPWNLAAVSHRVKGDALRGRCSRPVRRSSQAGASLHRNRHSVAEGA